MLKYVPLICVVVGILATLFSAAWVMSRKVSNGRISEAAGLVQDGISVFFKRMIIPLVIVTVAFSAVITFAVNWKAAVLYASGCVLAFIAVYYGMRITVKGNIRTAVSSAVSGPIAAFKIAYKSGAVVGLLICVLSLLGLGAVLVLFKLKSVTQIIACFGLGASTVAIFARIGGGIYNRASGHAAEKVTGDYPEIGQESINNPVYVSHKVGQEIGDVCGMSAEMLETYVGSLVAAVMLAAVAVNSSGVTSTFTLGTAALFPLIIAGIGLIVSIISMVFVRYSPKGEQIGPLVTASIIASVLISGASFYFSNELLQSYIYGVAISLGIICGLIVGPLSRINHETLPIIIVAAVVLGSYYCVGTYGIALTAIGMLSIVTMRVSYQAFGPITYNANFIAEFSNLSEDILEKTGLLKKIGRNTAPIGKSYSICAAALTAISLLISYAAFNEIDSISLLDPVILVSMLIGAMLPFSYSALVGKAAESVSNGIFKEAREQLRERKELVEGTAEPDYKACSKVAADYSIRAITITSMLAIFVPVIIGMLLGVQALGALIAGMVAAGALSAMTNKDISGTSINTFVKTVIFVSLVFSAVFINYGGVIL